tara:strand:+ start:94 stop:687 length:594 start_codon:yes stop_codon:yes gene_type:complete
MTKNQTNGTEIVQSISEQMDCKFSSEKKTALDKEIELRFSRIPTSFYQSVEIDGVVHNAKYIIDTDGNEIPNPFFNIGCLFKEGVEATRSSEEVARASSHLDSQQTKYQRAKLKAIANGATVEDMEGTQAYYIMSCAIDRYQKALEDAYVTAGVWEAVYGEEFSPSKHEEYSSNYNNRDQETTPLSNNVDMKEFGYK